MSSSAGMAADRERIIGELTRGRQVADQLRRMLREATSSWVSPAQGLVGKILESFTHSLSMLYAGGESGEVNQAPAAFNSPCSLKSEDSGDSCKTPPATKDRRGCYKRRRTSETWSKETTSLFEDGHAWRKYGQKVILNTKHPRNYFRCTHKYDQLCQASKQVQKIQDDPPLFRTTYHGQHTCKDLTKSSHQIIMDAAAQDDSSIIWSFANTPNIISSEAAAIKHEIIKEDHQLTRPPSDGDYFVPNDLTVFDHHTSANWGTAFSSGSDHGDVISSDVYSCTASTHSMEMDMNMNMMVGSVFDDLLELESLS